MKFVISAKRCGAIGVMGLVLTAVACRGGEARATSADPQSRYLFYLHGRIVEDLGEHPRSEEYGYYEYRKILRAFEEKGFAVRSEVRPKNTDEKQYAEKIAEQIRALKKNGVPSSAITVVGASKGGTITVFISNLLQDKALNFVILAGLFQPLLDDPDLKLYGNVLSIHDEADTFPLVPDEFFERSEGLGRHRAVVTHKSLGHGLLYQPYPEWVEPASAWARGTVPATAATQSGGETPKSRAQDITPFPLDGMLPVPGGTFTMGLNHPRAIADEQTEHAVTVAPFYLDKTEVTNGAYSACVQAGVCAPPRNIDTTKGGFASLAIFREDNRPVSGVSRQDAITFCKWKEKRLPTEAEFERAARGDDGRLYAWGNESPSPERAVYASKVTAAVGSVPKGAGPYGHLDLAGNVWEWTADLYDPFAYMRDTADRGIPADCSTIKKTQDQLRREHRQGFTGSNPIPTECDHVLRGGAFNYFSWGLRASNRVHHPETFKIIMAGFRCAADMP